MTSPSSSAGQWLRRYHLAARGGTRLVCFPHAGGSANYYFPLSRALAPGIEVLAVQYPGRQDRLREKPAGSVTELADSICAVLEPWMDGRAAFFGHSMGAIVAFEVARRLRDQSAGTPLRLLVSGHGAPSRPRNEAVHLRGDAGIVAEMRRLGGTSPRFLEDEDWVSLVLPAVRGDYQAIETYAYSPGPPLDCPVTALAGDSDPEVTTAELRAWAEHCTGGFESRTFPGGHFYINSCLPELARTISCSLRHGLAQA